MRSLLAGLRRVDGPVADAIEGTAGGFDLIAWTYDFYLTHRDFELDRAAVDAMIEQSEANERDIREASSWLRRLTRWLYTLGDMMPFLIPHLASERMELHLRDLVATSAMTMAYQIMSGACLKVPLLAAAGGGHPVLLIGHSMGSVISLRCALGTQSQSRQLRLYRFAADHG